MTLCPETKSLVRCRASDDPLKFSSVFYCSPTLEHWPLRRWRQLQERYHVYSTSSLTIKTYKNGFVKRFLPPGKSTESYLLTIWWHCPIWTQSAGKHYACMFWSIRVVLHWIYAYKLQLSTPHLGSERVSIQILENFRLHSTRVLITVNTRTTRDAVLPLSEPIQGVNGRMMDRISMPKGSIVLASILNSNCNAELWGQDSYEWKPERWLSPLPPAVAKAHLPGIYSHLCVLVVYLSDDGHWIPFPYRMTFIGGGRACMCVQSITLIPALDWFIPTSGFKFA